MTDAAMPATTRELADFIVRTRPADRPETVPREGTRAFLNWGGYALGGCRHDVVAIVSAAAAAFSGEKHAPVLGYGRILGGINAAFCPAGVAEVARASSV